MAKRITTKVFYDYEDQWNESGYKIDGDNIIYFHEDRKEQQGGEEAPIPYTDFINNSKISEELRNWAKAYFGVK